MKKLLTALVILFSLSFSSFAQNTDRDEQMINASLRFIKENANLTKKEYEKFAKLYIEYNEQLAKLNRELNPESRDYIKRWSSVNDDYMKKMEKALPDSTRKKIGLAQFELGQKVWRQRSEQNRQSTERQCRVMGQWNQMNPQFMIQPHMYDFQRHRQREMQQADEQQQQWWENYWKNWQMPDSATIRRYEERRKRYEENRGSFPFGPVPGAVPGGVPGSGNNPANRQFNMSPGYNWNPGSFPPAMQSR